MSSSSEFFPSSVKTNEKPFHFVTAPLKIVSEQEGWLLAFFYSSIIHEYFVKFFFLMFKIEISYCVQDSFYIYLIELKDGRGVAVVCFRDVLVAVPWWGQLSV